MAGAKGAKATAAPPPYEYQEYPKVLHGENGEQVLVADAEAEARHLKKTKIAWSDTPTDFLEDGHPDKPDAPEEGSEEAKPKSKAKAKQ